MSSLGKILGTAAPIVGTMLGGPAVGAALTAFSAAEGAQDQQRNLMRMSSRQMDFQREMSNTAYQRAVKDMQAAGLNPMLAYSQGGASSPGGSSPVLGPNVGASSAQGFAQAAGAFQDVAQEGRTRAETMPYGELLKRLDAEISKLASEIALNDQKRQLLMEEARKMAVEAGIAERVAGIRTKAELELWLRDLNEARNANEITGGDYGQLLKWLERIMPLFRGYGGTLRR